MSDRGQDLRLLEALLFAAAQPLDEATLATRLPEGTDIAGLLAELAETYRNRGVTLEKVAGGWAGRLARGHGGRDRAGRAARRCGRRCRRGRRGAGSGSRIRSTAAVVTPSCRARQGCRPGCGWRGLRSRAGTGRRCEGPGFLPLSARRRRTGAPRYRQSAAAAFQCWSRVLSSKGSRSRIGEVRCWILAGPSWR